MPFDAAFWPNHCIGHRQRQGHSQGLETGSSESEDTGSYLILCQAISPSILVQYWKYLALKTKRPYGLPRTSMVVLKCEGCNRQGNVFKGCNRQCFLLLLLEWRRVHIRTFEDEQSLMHYEWEGWLGSPIQVKGCYFCIVSFKIREVKKICWSFLVSGLPSGENMGKRGYQRN